ncbi:MAG: hypothetical protein ACRD8U_13925 [Pyrinomonadaceae bacterium]
MQRQLSILVALILLLGLLPMPTKAQRASYNGRIAPQGINLRHGQFISYSFEIPESEHYGIVRGWFAVKGSNRLDVRVLILDSSNLDNFKNGDSFSNYLDTGLQHSANINVRLPRGQFYLVFDNTHSLLTNKSLRTDLTLLW